MLKICREIGTPMVKGTFEHCTEANTGTALAAGAWAAISVQLWCGMIAKKVADLVKRLGNGRIIPDFRLALLECVNLIVVEVLTKARTGYE